MSERVVYMTEALGEGWTLTQDAIDRERGRWTVCHDGNMVGLITRTSADRGVRGWEARLYHCAGPVIQPGWSRGNRGWVRLWRTRLAAAESLVVEFRRVGMV
ncbi:hypothetical protein GCM10012275_28120 [Longimycelium tulufanense]|uniref:Uncharacterized protein n=1 Tax=Longimycelium tulufanense TaxID=907463 RepID=A0A8J3CE62_9PSEU|nr:hypothetical protein GCM10012275_28120 [Longimycelium tulufanense]